MTDPLTDYRRVPAPPRHPGQVDPATDWAATAGLVRTVLAFLLGAAAALTFASALVLAVGAVQVLSPERPARVVPVLLSAPEVRLGVAQDWAAELETDRGVPFTAVEQAEMVDVLDQVLASPELHRQLRELRPVDGRIDGTALVATLASALREQADGRPREVQLVIEETAATMPLVLEEEGSSADATEELQSLTQLRRWALVAAAVLAVPGVVAAAIALAVARRRPLTAVLVASGSLLVAVVVLAPGRFVLAHLPGPLSIAGHVLAAIGELSGPATVWALLLAVAVPPGVWGALRSLRGTQVDAAPTT